MQELVGYCKVCIRKIYCNDGFINGIVLDDKALLCFDCYSENKLETSE